jgi:hypothetical protein
MVGKYLKFILISLVAYVLAACSATNVEPDPMREGYNFFPLKKGIQREYLVEELRYNSFDDSVLKVYELKEIVVDSFIDQENEVVYLLNRYTRTSSTVPWREDPDSVWSAKISKKVAVVNENTVPFIKLVFPVKEGLEWNGNGMNGYESEDYTIRDLNKRFVSNYTDNKTLTVVQKDDDSEISTYRKLEIYAYDSGLVYKENINLQYNEEKIGEKEIKYGTKTKQWLIKYVEQ